MSSRVNSNRDRERLVQHRPSSTDDDDPPSSIINHNDDYSTFTPKASDDDESRNTNSKDEENEDTTCCCDCWKENRFAIILALILLACFAVPLRILIRHAHFEFDYHRECVTCFNDKADFEVIFNQTSGTCELYFQNETYDSNHIVLDPNFCGAPHCQNLELLPGLRLVPYWALAVSAVFSILLSVGLNLMKYNCYLPIKKKFVKWKWDEELVEENPIIRLADEYGEAIREAAEKNACGMNLSQIRSDLETLRKLSIFLKTFGLTDPYFFMLLFLFAAGHFIFCAHEVVTKPTFAHLDGWHKYQTIYGLFLNSGSIEVLWFRVSMFPLGEGGVINAYFFSENLSKFIETNIDLVPNHLWEDAVAMARHLDHALTMPLIQFGNTNICILSFPVFLGFSVLATTPVFLTHAVPGIVLFIPYWAGILFALWITSLLIVFAFPAFISYFLDSCSQLFSVVSLVMVSLVMVWIRLLGSFFVLLLPIIFNWTVLFYEGRTWSDVMTGEYRLRNTDCYFNAIVNDIQIYNVGFVGLIFS